MKYIAIEGNIGIGKSTLAELLAKHFAANLILENFSNNPYIEKFYQNQIKYSLPLELFFLSERYEQLEQQFTNTSEDKSLIISDFFYFKSNLFAQINLPKIYQPLYNKISNLIMKKHHKPDLIIYLTAPLNFILEQIKIRNREYEKNIKENYLRQIDKIYYNYFQQNGQNVLTIERTNLDFLNNPFDLNFIINKIQTIIF